MIILRNLGVKPFCDAMAQGQGDAIDLGARCAFLAQPLITKFGDIVEAPIAGQFANNMGTWANELAQETNYLLHEDKPTRAYSVNGVKTQTIVTVAPLLGSNGLRANLVSKLHQFTQDAAPDMIFDDDSIERYRALLAYSLICSSRFDNVFVVSRTKYTTHEQLQLPHMLPTVDFKVYVIPQADVPRDAFMGALVQSLSNTLAGGAQLVVWKEIPPLAADYSLAL